MSLRLTAAICAVSATLCNSAHAELDGDAARKLSALKSLALSAAPISPKQVEKALALTLDRSCADVELPPAGKFHICLYRPAEQDTHNLAFVQYKTINRSAGEESGGSVEFLTKGEHTCIRSKDLNNAFQLAPAPSGAPAFPEPKLPYIPVARYQFNFPNQGAHVEVFQTGECVTTVTLVKTS